MIHYAARLNDLLYANNESNDSELHRPLVTFVYSAGSRSCAAFGIVIKQIILVNAHLIVSRASCLLMSNLVKPLLLLHYFIN